MRKRRREGNARAAQGTTRVESRYTIQTCDPSVSRTAVRWGPQFFFERPAKIPRSFLRSFSLWACSAHATFGLHRFSLTQFAARLAMGKLAAAGVTPGSAVGAEALAVRAAYEVAVRNELPYFAPVTMFPGFARATAATIGDLRAAGVAAERLETLEESGPDHAALLKCFQEQMERVLVADRTLLLQAALEEIRAGADLARCPLLLLDVPVHSAIERAFLVELASAAKELLVTCPAGDFRTLDNLKMVPGAQEDAATPMPKYSSLARLGFYLFSETAPPEGITFDRMAVLLRAPETYASLIEAAMRRAGIPAYFARGSRRPDPSGRALLALLACAAEGLSAHRFAEYLSFAQVPSLAQDGAPLESKTELVPPEDDALNSAASAFARPMPNTSQDEDGYQLKDADKPELAGALRAPWKWEELLVDAASRF